MRISSVEQRALQAKDWVLGRHRSLRLAWVLSSLFVFSPSRSSADEPSTAGSAPAQSSRSPLIESESESEHLTGDWGGWRTRLVERGVHFQAGYIGETFGNVSGGLRRGAIYEGLVEAAIELDIERITRGWRGAILRASAILPHGNSPSRELTGDVQGLSNIDAYDSLALYELWLEQNLWEGRVSLRAGQLLADAEFGYTDYGGALLNSSFGWPAFNASNTRNSVPAYFRAGLGLRVRVEPAPGLFVQAGIYDGDTFDNDAGRASGNPHGVNFSLSGHQGAFAISEIGWRKPGGTNDLGLSGTYKLGAWLHTAEFDDVLVAGRTHGRNHGFYVAGEQRIWAESDGDGQGLGAFVRVGFAPTDRNFVRAGADAGLHYVGLLPGRDVDTLALGIAAIWISDDFREAERQAGADVLSDHEIAVEIAYQFQIRPWFTLQPDLQWIHHPGASRAIDDALVLGLRARFTF